VFYAYAYPEPEGFRSYPVKPAAARYDEELREQLKAFSLNDPRFVNPALWNIHEAT